MRANPGLSYGRVGGEIGQRLSRAAFAVMIKLSGLGDDFRNVLEELQDANEFFPSEEGE